MRVRAPAVTVPGRLLSFSLKEKKFPDLFHYPLVLQARHLTRSIRKSEGPDPSQSMIGMSFDWENRFFKDRLLSPTT